MKEYIYVYGEDCSKCHMLEPHITKRAEENGIELHKYKFTDLDQETFQITSIPALIIRDEEDIKTLQYEEIISLITNQ